MGNRKPEKASAHFGAHGPLLQGLLFQILVIKNRMAGAYWSAKRTPQTQSQSGRCPCERWTNHHRVRPETPSSLPINAPVHDLY